MPAPVQKWRKFLRGFAKWGWAFLGVCVLLYILDSEMGGYWMIPARDGHVRFKPEFGGLSMTVAILWQPRFGHNSLGDVDLIGILFDPLIQLDRSWVHHSHYMTEDDFENWIAHLPVSKVHPRLRDEYVTKVTVKAVRDEADQAVRCILRLTGSARPRSVTEIRIDRKLAQALGASPPQNFIETPFEGVEAHRNERTVRWLGQIALPQGQDVLIALPVTYPKEGTGTIVFVYCYSDDTVDSAARARYQICSVKLGPGE